MNLTIQPETDPLEIYRFRDSIYAVDMITVGLVYLDFFTWLAKKPANLKTICRHFHTTARPTDVMLTLFTSLGLVKNTGGVFRASKLSREHLVQGSPWFLGAYYASLKDRPVCVDLLKVLRTGKPANWGSSKSEKEWSKAMEAPDFARTFTAAMDCRGVYLGRAMAKALDLRRHHRFLDIAGGSGIYACATVAEHPHLSAAVFEKPPVNHVAAKLIAERGYAERVSVIAGDMFSEPLPKGFDVHLFSNVLHDWDTLKVRRLLTASFRALEPGGLLVIHDMHLNAAKTGPRAVAEYSVILMHSTEGKCYSVGELKPLLRELGFGKFGFRLTTANRSVLTARKPK